MKIEILRKRISLEEAKKTAEEQYGDMFKAVVDIKKETIAIGGELHADANELLIKNGSDQDNVWGINIFPDNPPESFIEFNSLINIKPSQNNRSLDIENEEIKEKIRNIVNKLINHE